MAMPRTGSSMISGIFAAHGVWCGKCMPPSPHNEKGFFENLAIKAILKRRWPGLVRNDGMARPQSGFADEIGKVLEDEHYPGGPWFVKMSAMFWPAWVEFEPTWVVIRRKPESIVASNVATAMMGMRDQDQVKEIVEWHMREMDVLVGAGAVEIKSDDVIAGDFSSLDRAFKHCGLKFKPAVARGLIDCSLWHHE